MFTGHRRVSESNNFVVATIKSKLSLFSLTRRPLLSALAIFIYFAWQIRVSCRRRRLHKNLNLQRCVIKFLHFFYVKFHLPKPPMSDESTLYFERLTILVSTYWNTSRSTNMKSFISLCHFASKFLRFANFIYPSNQKWHLNNKRLEREEEW